RRAPGGNDQDLRGRGAQHDHDPQRRAADPRRGGRRRRATLARVVGSRDRRRGLFCARPAPGLRARRTVSRRRQAMLGALLALTGYEDGTATEAAAPPATTPAVVTAMAPEPAPAPPPPPPKPK